jgi:hypothetical protein
MKKNPLSVWILTILLAFQSLGALYGGLALLISPSGEFFQMPLSMLEGSPFSSFFIPGLILLVVLGIFPGLISFAVIRKPDWKYAGIFNLYKGIHWSWGYSVYLAIMLVVWILLEIVWVGYDLLQTIYGLLGVVILVFALLPATMKHFGWRYQE